MQEKKMSSGRQQRAHNRSSPYLGLVRNTTWTARWSLYVTLKARRWHDGGAVCGEGNEDSAWSLERLARGGTTVHCDGLGQCDVAGAVVLFYGCFGFLSRMMSTNVIQQRCHSRNCLGVTKKNLKYNAKYSNMLVGPT